MPEIRKRKSERKRESNKDIKEAGMDNQNLTHQTYQKSTYMGLL